MVFTLIAVGAEPSMLSGNPKDLARPEPTINCGMYMRAASR